MTKNQEVITFHTENRRQTFNKKSNILTRKLME